MLAASKQQGQRVQQDKVRHDCGTQLRPCIQCNGRSVQLERALDHRRVAAMESWEGVECKW